MIVLLLALFLAACNVNQKEEDAQPLPPTGVENPGTPAEEPETSQGETPAEGDDVDDVDDDDSFTVPDTFEPEEYTLEDAFPHLTFKEPLALTYDNTDDDTVYVVERHGLVYSVSLDDSGPKTVYLDLSETVDTKGQEMGLLGLAFHPQFEDNGYLYVNYTKDGKTFISRFTHGDEAPVALSTEKVLLTYDQPYNNHNGGSLLFGDDGYLYIASGDGGSGGDPDNHAQNLRSYLGKLLRIDVDTEEEAYLIPQDNPFALQGGDVLEEIYAYGLRNPWKFSFDPGRDLIIAADVGQGEIEEIDLITPGGNYGWNIFEGTRAFRGGSIDNHIPPVYEYPHSEGRSITGGFTYYGDDMDSLRGAYIYGDFISGRIWALWLDSELNAANYELLDTDLMISSFGLDQDGEIYVIDFQGKIYMMEEED